VAAREQVVGQEDVAIRAATDDQSTARDRKTPAFSRSGQKLDFRHADPSEQPELIPRRSRRSVGELAAGREYSTPNVVLHTG
jgi:hypothetical protein